MSLTLKRRIIIRDVKGHKILDTGLVNSHSFVKGFLGAIGGFLAGGKDVVDIYGATQRTVPTDLYDTDEDEVLYMGGEGDELTGIVVGSDSSPETVEDTSLAVRIGANVLYPSNHYFLNIEDATSASLIIIRAFTNLTGNQAALRETGIQAHDKATHWWRKIIGYQDYPPYLPITQLRFEPYDWYGLIVRDVLDAPYSVPVGGVVSVQYIFELPKS